VLEGSRFLHLLVASIELLFGQLELGFLLLHFLLEDHLHLGLHLGQLHLVRRSLFCHLGRRAVSNKVKKVLGFLTGCSLDLLEDGRVLSDAHAEQLSRSVALVEDVLGVLLEFLHMRANQHLA
jgi:hypothetical protein